MIEFFQHPHDVTRSTLEGCVAVICRLRLVPGTFSREKLVAYAQELVDIMERCQGAIEFLQVLGTCSIKFSLARPMLGYVSVRIAAYSGQIGFPADEILVAPDDDCHFFPKIIVNFGLGLFGSRIDGDYQIPER